jgi:uncharacterized membrane protein
MSEETQAPAAAHRRKKGWGPIRYARSRPRLLIGAVIAVVAAVGLEFTGLQRNVAFLLGFDIGVLAYLLMILRIFLGATQANMRRQARMQDSGRWTTLLSGVALSAVVLIAVTTELHSDSKGGAFAIAVAASTIILSWMFMNTLFALHYAHGYYGDFGAKHKGLDFPGDEDPDYWDFAYFSFTIGMTFQVSDVQITTRYLRRIGLMHSAIAFFFNVFIIAISVNIAAGKA